MRALIAALALLALLALPALAADAPINLRFVPPASAALKAEILAADQAFFAALFDRCDVTALADSVTEDFEFFHDKGGRNATSGKQFVDNLRGMCERQRQGIDFLGRRVLEPASLEVHPITGYGAVENGYHRFYAVRAGKPDLPTENARFTHVWRKDADRWRLARVMSYDHRPAQPAGTVFFDALRKLCGATFVGQSVFPTDPKDAFFGKPLTARFASCTADEIRVPFQVGGDRSRTWVFTRTPGGIQLKHDHRHADGTPDAITDYGGLAEASGSELSQAFKADAHTAALIPAAATNVWTISVSADGATLNYALTRDGKPRFEAALRRATSN